MRGAFTFDALKRVVRASDSATFKVNLSEERVALVESAMSAAEHPESALKEFRTTTARKKRCIYYDAYDSVLILRAISRYLANRFRVVTPNRDRVVQSVIEALSDSTPLFVIRRDISSFYENVPVDKVRNRLLYDTALPRSLRGHLRTFFDVHSAGRLHGVPRGTGLSGVLVELAMNDFDRAIRALPSVYRYFRYSDDILIFCYENPGDIEEKLDDILSRPMKFNPTKSDTINYAKKKGEGERVVSFTYLGYKFSASEAGNNSKPRKVFVSVSEEKIRRIKTRIILSLKRFRRDRNAKLLIQRMRFLSGNFRISKTPAFFQESKKYIMSGIYYNYRRCGVYSNGVYSESDRVELRELDWFYRRVAFGQGEFGPIVNGTVGIQDLDTLKKISFRRGYMDRLSAKVPVSLISTIREPWRNQ